MADNTDESQSKVLVNEHTDDSGITMLDVLEEEQELEEDANAVLGACDDQNCTYSQGYIKRQALYACRTCSSPNTEPAGICLACSYACHGEHELYELYTKRKFRCDCGNSRFPNRRCRLYPDKEPTNINNKYNQNFCGKYCICARPYPDPDDDVPDEMVQCIICEDWYHGRHLGNDFPLNHDYSEMICGECMGKHGFLWLYNISFNDVKIKKEETEEHIDIESPKNKKESSEFHKDMKNGDQTSISYETADSGTEESNQDAVGIKLDSASSNDDESSKIKSESACILKQLQNGYVFPPQKHFTLWQEGWRKKLCKCPQCFELYRQHNCSYLLDEDDTVHSYEERGKASNGTESQYAKGMTALQGLDRVKQMEAIHEYNSMKSELKDFLKKFVDTKKVVREEDIWEFFEQMKARKRQRTECQIQHYCR